MAYAGYVYKPYPKMIKSELFGPPGYKIVNSEEEHAQLTAEMYKLMLDKVEQAPVNQQIRTSNMELIKPQGKPGKKSKLMFTEG
jgi:hypothetical protein